MKIILASKSPRRIEMMNELFDSFEIKEANVSEFVSSYNSSEDLVMQLSMKKAECIFNDNKDALVLGFDTLVFCDNEIMGKPQNEEECINMISKLSNHNHIVVTGVTMIANDYKESFYSKCLVHFTTIPLEDIVKYSKTKEPYDKAGGYAIQGYIGRYIDKIEGDYFTVVGFPKALVYSKVMKYLKGRK